MLLCAFIWNLGYMKINFFPFQIWGHCDYSNVQGRLPSSCYKLAKSYHENRNMSVFPTWYIFPKLVSRRLWSEWVLAAKDLVFTTDKSSRNNLKMPGLSQITVQDCVYSFLSSWVRDRVCLWVLCELDKLTKSPHQPCPFLLFYLSSCSPSAGCWEEEHEWLELLSDPARFLLTCFCLGKSKFQLHSLILNMLKEGVRFSGLG